MLRLKKPFNLEGNRVPVEMVLEIYNVWLDGEIEPFQKKIVNRCRFL